LPPPSPFYGSVFGGFFPRGRCGTRGHQSRVPSFLSPFIETDPSPFSLSVRERSRKLPFPFLPGWILLLTPFFLSPFYSLVNFGPFVRFGGGFRSALLPFSRLRTKVICESSAFFFPLFFFSPSTSRRGGSGHSFPFGPAIDSKMIG